MPDLSDPPSRTDDTALDDLAARLRSFRRVDLAPGDGWSRGVDAAYLADLLAYWADGYDRRAQEERLLALPWQLTGRDGPPLRVVHQRAEDDDAVPVLLLHGWPDSALRSTKVQPLLRDSHVVVPALPGFPFAAPVPGGGMSAARIAQVCAAAMAELGYSRYVVSAGDVGNDVAEVLAHDSPDAVAALHLTDVSRYRFLVDPPADLSDRERAYVEHGHRWQRDEGGYMHLQRTKPHTLAVGLGDSPAGLAAWLLEKLRSWTDCGGDVERVFSRDELLTWISAYWFSGAIGTSSTPYAESGAPPARIPQPAVFTICPVDLVNAPREFAERFFDVRSCTEGEREAGTSPRGSAPRTTSRACAGRWSCADPSGGARRIAGAPCPSPDRGTR